MFFSDGGFNLIIVMPLPQGWQVVFLSVPLLGRRGVHIRNKCLNGCKDDLVGFDSCLKKPCFRNGFFGARSALEVVHRKLFVLVHNEVRVLVLAQAVHQFLCISRVWTDTEVL